MGKRKKGIKKDCLLNCRSIEIHTKTGERTGKLISHNARTDLREGEERGGRTKINQPPIAMFMFEFHI